jgi:hypothetical protein
MIFVKFVLLKIVSEVFDWPLFALLSFFLLVNIVVFMLFLMNDCLLDTVANKGHQDK